MNADDYVGRVYLLADCPAFNSDADAVTISGRYTVSEYDDENGALTAVFYVQPLGTADDDYEAMYAVDVSDLYSNIMGQAGKPAFDQIAAESGDETLHCQAGDHIWRRPKQRGKKPINCPEHRPTPPASSGSQPTKLWCELGEHEWERERKQGVAPKNCPEHKPTPARAERAPEILHCEIGDHDWTREDRRGRVPLNCPEHRPIVVREAKPDGRRSKRVEGIQSILDARIGCACEVRADMTDDELMFGVQSCTAGYVCGTLDRIRGNYVDYNRHTRGKTESTIDPVEVEA